MPFTDKRVMYKGRDVDGLSGTDVNQVTAWTQSVLSLHYMCRNALGLLDVIGIIFH